MIYCIFYHRRCKILSLFVLAFDDILHIFCIDYLFFVYRWCLSIDCANLFFWLSCCLYCPYMLKLLSSLSVLQMLIVKRWGRHGSRWSIMQDRNYEESRMYLILIWRILLRLEQITSEIPIRHSERMWERMKRFGIQQRCVDGLSHKVWRHDHLRRVMAEMSIIVRVIVHKKWYRLYNILITFLLVRQENHISHIGWVS